MEIPKLSAAHVDIHEHSVSRALGTGHPRLLCAVLTNRPRKVLAAVQIERLTVNGEVKVAKASECEEDCGGREG